MKPIDKVGPLARFTQKNQPVAEKPVKPAKAVKPPKEKAPKQPKTPKVKQLKPIAHFQKKLAACRIVMLQSASAIAVAKSQSVTVADLDKLLLDAQSKFSSYYELDKWLQSSWNPDGTRIPLVIREGFKGCYWFKANHQIDPETKESIGWISKVFHWGREKVEGEKTKSFKIFDHETGIFNTADEANEAAKAWLIVQGLERQIGRRFRLWFAGEREYDKDVAFLDGCRETAISSVLRLVTAGRNAHTPIETIETLAAECRKPLTRYMSLKQLHATWWNAEGQWIGAKKKVKKPKPVAEIVDPVV